MKSTTAALLSSVTWAQIDLAYQIFIYGFILTLNTPGVVKNYQRRYKKSSNLPLYTHLAVGIIEVFRYHVKAAAASSGGSGATSGVVPDMWDLAMCYIHAYGSLKLAKDLLKGHPVISRAVYQSEALVRIALTTAAYALGSPFLHRASIKSTNNFIYTRFGIFFAIKSKLFPYSVSYAIGSGLSPLLAMSETGIPAALFWFLGLAWFVIKLNRWTSARILKRYVVISHCLFFCTYNYRTCATIMRLELFPLLGL
jgi:hypothetical protein